MRWVTKRCLVEGGSLPVPAVEVGQQVGEARGRESVPGPPLGV